MMKSVHAWTPAVFGMAAPHALSGATAPAVKSSQGSSINVQAGENLTYQFTLPDTQLEVSILPAYPMD